MIRHAVLDEKRNVVEVSDILEYGKFCDVEENVRVGKTTVRGAKVSTVFLGTDLSFGREAPQWFETMIFGGKHDGWCDRYATWAEAEAGHAEAVKMVTDDV